MELREELVSVNHRNVKRRMDTQSHGGAAGGEVRRLHIIYFLSRNGRVDHPHLIRVHHLSRNGVRLRDVKRWLSELRGKDIPESFSWSYKRKYRTGYVWQDLVDEDLITPISDNEYVLKGSEIVSTSCEFCSYRENNKASIRRETPLETDQKHHTIRKLAHPEAAVAVSANPHCEIQEQSPPFGSDTSTMTDECSAAKLEEDKVSAAPKQCSNKSENSCSYSPSSSSSSSFYTNLLNKKGKSKSNSSDIKSSRDKAKGGGKSASSQSAFTRSKSHSSGASNILRNLINCGGVDTNDSAMVTINRRDRASMNAPTDAKPVANTAEICRGDKLGGSERTFGTFLTHQPHPYSSRKSCDGEKTPLASGSSKSETINRASASAAYKPASGPNCSQCGKTFKPEKLHIHMKSCKGMRALGKGVNPTTAAEKTPLMDSYKESVSAYFLTN